MTCYSRRNAPLLHRRSPRRITASANHIRSVTSKLSPQSTAPSKGTYRCTYAQALESHFGERPKPSFAPMGPNTSAPKVERHRALTLDERFSLIEKAQKESRPQVMKRTRTPNDGFLAYIEACSEATRVLLSRGTAACPGGIVPTQDLRR